MSKTVDERVVEMRFDNKNFENNVATSMSTLDKLKRSLKFDGASKGLENIDKAAKNINFSGLSTGIETVQSKFSALQVMGVTALANITNSAVNAGKRIASALTIDPVKSGFQEYETQMGAIQTILANTQKEGTNVERVNAALDELNLYADKTIYNFTEMTKNIGTFTAAGVKLDTSVQAIKGIANLAAVSGSTSVQASTAMYQLSQALAAGKVSLMDWNSVVNAGMGGQVFQDALVRTSEHLKTGANEAIKTYGSFRESLTKGEWLTTEVLTETLNQIAGAYSKAELIAQGYSETQAEEISKLADTATAAATEVKTFTQLWDTLKEAAQSGWGQTWRLIIGDFDAAKERMTKLSELFGNIIGNSANRRNAVVGGALTSSWDKLTEKMNAAGIKTEEFQNRIIELSGTHKKEFEKMIEEEGSFGKGLKRAFSEGLLNKSILKDTIKSFTGGIDKATGSTKSAADQMEKFGEIVDKVIVGDFGNGADRVKALTDAGYDYATIQDLVNEKLGVSYRHLDALNEEQLKNADSLSKMSDEQLKSKGYTEEQITALRELSKAADESGSSIDELLNDISKPSGSELIWDSLHNIIDSIVVSLKAVKTAWAEAFHPGMSEDEILAERAEKLYKLIDAFHSLTERIKVDDETAKEITRTFKGLFALIDIITTIAGGGFKLAFQVLSKILGAFNMDVLDLTAKLGDMLVKFRDFLFNNDYINKGFDLLAKGIVKAAKGIKKLYDAFMDLPQVTKVIDRIKGAFDHIKDIDLSEIGANIIDGLRNGLDGGISKIWSKMLEIGKSIIDTIRGILGIHSPSTVMFEIGKNIVLGLVNGVSAGFTWVVETVKKLGNKIVDTVSDIDWGVLPETVKTAFDRIKNFFSGFDYSKLLAIIPIAAVLIMVKTVYSTANVLARGINSLNEVIEGFALVEQNFAKVLNAYALNIKAEALKKIAIAIAILAGSVIALSFVDTKKLYASVGVIGILAGILVGLTISMELLSKSSASIDRNGVKIDGLKSGLLAIAGAILIMGIVTKMLGKMKPDELKQGLMVLAGFAGGLVVLFAVLTVITNFAGQNSDKVSGLLMKVSIAMLLMVGVCKLASKLTPEEMKKGVIFAGAFTVFCSVLIAASYLAGKQVDKVGGMLIKISIAMALMVGVCKLAAKLTPEEMLKGGAFALAFVVFVALLTKATQIDNGKEMAKLGGLLLSISVSLMLMVGVCKLVSLLTPGEMIKGASFVGGFIVLVGILVQLTTITNGQQMAKVAGTILALSAAIAILAGVAVLLSLMPTDALIKGVAAVTFLGLIMSAMIWATKGANNVKGNLIVMTVAIAVMASAVVALSMIDFKSLASATGSLVSVMATFALLIKTASSAQGAIAPLIVMTAAVGLLGGLLYLLAKLPVDSVLGTAISLSVLLVALSLSMKLASSVNVSAGVLVSLAAMTAVIGALAFILYQLRDLPAESSISAAKSLSLLLAAMAGVMAALALVGSFAGGGALAGVAVLGVLTLVVGGLAYILYQMQDMPVESTMGNVKALSILLLTLSGTCILLSVVGALAPAALVGIATLTALIVGLGALVVGIGYLVNEFPQIEDFIDTGIPILEKLAYGLGSIAGNLIAGFSNAVMQTLPLLGTSLSQFMINATPFIIGVKMVDDSVLKGVGILSAAILALTVADFINGITQLLPFVPSLSDMGTQLSNFMSNSTGFIIGANLIKPEAMSGIKALAEAIMIITAADVIDGLASAFGLTSGNSVEDFGSQLGKLGSGLNSFATNLGKFDEDTTKTVSCGAEAIKKLAEAADTIPNSGGFLSRFTGDNDIGTFATQFPIVGTGLAGFAANIGTFTDSQAKTVECAADAIKKLAEAADEIPNSGGWAGKIAGENDLGNFADDFPKVGTGLAGFASNIGTFTDTQISTVECGAKAIKLLAEAADEIPNEGGYLAKVVGDNDIGTFAEKFPKLGAGLAGFAQNMGSLNETQMAAISTGATAIGLIGKAAKDMNDGWMAKFLDQDTDLEEFASQLGKLGTGIKNFATNMGTFDADALASFQSALSLIDSLGSNYDDLSYIAESVSIFSDNLDELGSAFKSYADNVSNVDDAAKSVTTLGSLVTFTKNLNGLSVDDDKIESFKESVTVIGQIDLSKLASTDQDALGKAVANITRLIGVINKMTSVNTSGVESFKSAVSSLGKTNLNNFISTFSGSSAKLSSVGGGLIDSLNKGIQSKSSSVTAAVTDIVGNIVNSISNKATQLVAAGASLMSNLLKGINDKKSAVTSSAISAVTSAASAIKLSYTEFYNSGSYLGDGLVLGINAQQTAAYNAGYALGQKAVQGEKDGQKSHSPSKATFQSGIWLGQGLVNGIKNISSSVYKSGYSLGSTATKSISSAISIARDMINSDMDTQPTIRPVLDLSDVRSGASSINGMFNSGPSLAISSNLNAISSSMNQRSQNGSMSDIVSAIDKLRKDVNSNGGTTNYNINGVTYDDGSNISTAVGEIVRAARIERRR